MSEPRTRKGRPAAPADDYLSIPDFLRVDAAEAERRRKWNAEHPVVAMRFTETSIDRNAERAKAKARLAALQAEEDEEKALKTVERRAKSAGKAMQRPPGTHWDSRVGKWKSDKMSAQNYARLLAEMPTPEHRAVLTKFYGADGAAGPTTVRPAAPRAPAAPTTKILDKVLGVTKVAVPKPQLNKAQQTAKVSAMLERPEGATLDEIGSEMGWQNHSASAFLSGIRKSRTITSTVEARGRVYRLEPVKT